MNINKISVDSKSHALRPYGECSTAAATAAKVVTCTDFTTLYTGATILVNFPSANTASAPTLDVNGTGAKNVVLSGSIPVTALSGLCEFVYNGTGWVVLSTGRIAALDTNGKISSSVLPSYVDDVIEGYYYNSKFYKEKEHTTTIAGTSGVVYVDITNNSGDVYRYSGSTFVKITSSPDHTHSISLTATVGSSTNGTTSVATGSHSHSITFNSFNPTGTTDANSTDIETVSKSTHTHPVSVNGDTGNNTSSVDIPTSTHTHTVTAIGTIGAPTYKDTEGSQIAKVASAGHSHTFKGTEDTTVASTDSADVAAQAHTHVFSGTEVDSGSKAITSKAEGGVLTLTTAHTHKVTAAGSVAQTKTPKVVASQGTHTHSYTPKGSIAAPATGTAANFTDVASTAHIHVFTGTEITSSGPSATGKAAAVTHKHSIAIGTTATENSTAVATVSKSNHTHTFTGSAVTPSIKTQSVAANGTVNVPSTAHKHDVTVSGSTGSSTDK